MRARSPIHLKSAGPAWLLAAITCLVLTACGGAEDTTNVAADAPLPEPAAAQTVISRSPTPTPVVTTEMVAETEPIPFTSVTRDDPSMAKGKTAVTTVGVNGVRTLTYRVTLVDGRETDRTLITDRIKVPPVDEVTSVGSYEPPPAPKPPAKAEKPAPDPKPAAPAKPRCDSNYSGCVPIDSDVDCAGGSGNGPSYVEGPVNIISSDPYKLDADHDGIGCED